jgi:hypothetical protein
MSSTTSRPTVATIETSFQTYGEYLDAQTHFMLFDRPSEAESAMLVVPMTYCPNVSTLLDDSNWEGLQSAMAEADPTGETYQICSFGHWATPFKFMIVTAGSAAHIEAERITDALSDYPVLDDEDFSRREYEATIANIASELGRTTVERNGVEVDSEELAGELFSWFWDNNQGAVEARDGNGGYPSSEEIEDGLRGLGFVDLEDGSAWLPESETEPVAADE